MAIQNESQNPDGFSGVRPLRRLSGAVLLQAMHDLSSGPPSLRRDALEWVNATSAEGYTFELCCLLLNRDPDDLRSKLKERLLIPKWSPDAARR